MDKNGDRSLDYDEMKALLHKGNPQMTERELRLLFRKCDRSGDGRISFDEFVNYIFSWTQESAEGERELEGPAHFYYDQSTYTGTQAKEAKERTGLSNSGLLRIAAAPSAAAEGSVRRNRSTSGTLELSRQRSFRSPRSSSPPQSDRGRHSSRKLSYNSTGNLLEPHAYRPRAPSSHSSLGDAGSPSLPRDDSTTLPSLPGHAGHARGAGARGREGGQPLRGPERFFYDKSSYTGTSQHGGLSHVDGTTFHSSFRGGSR